MVVDRRPEILFVCNSAFATEIIITLLECAEYSVTWAQTKADAVDWLGRRRFAVAVLDSCVPEPQQLGAEIQLHGIPIVPMCTSATERTRTGITGDAIKSLLTALFTVAPLSWMKRQDVSRPPARGNK